MRASLLIVYHSQSGASAALAVAAQEGARMAGVEVMRRRAVDCGASDVAAASALLLICAENSGRLAGGAKEFLDRIFYPLLQREVVRPYALLVSAGNDGSNAVAEAQRIFRGIPFPEAMEPRIIVGPPDSADLEQAREVGEAFATGVSMGIF